MLKLKRVAITGGLSCGKTTVCRLFKELGAFIILSDDIVHSLLTIASPYGKEVVKLLGPEVVTENQLNRQLIARRVFENPELLKNLEKILHPAVKEEIEKQYESVKKSSTFSLFVAEIPLLFESGLFNDWFDFIIAVVSDQQLCIERFEKSTKYDKNEYERRMSKQLNPLKKAMMSDYVIVNNYSSLDSLKIAVKELFNEINQQSF